MKIQGLKTGDYLLCAFFAALITVGAFIRIPVPVVPFTLQFLFTLLAGLLLGARLGSLSVLMYIGMGLIGLPVFVEGGGIGYIAKPSFGYLIGFYAGAYVTGCIANQVTNPSYKRLLYANGIGLFIVYAFGLTYYFILSNSVLGLPISMSTLFLYGFILAVPGDILLCIAGAIIAKRLYPVIYRYRRIKRTPQLPSVIPSKPDMEKSEEFG